MGMVDRYKKSGGFIQLVQVIETCNPKKREQFMNIITEESPEWADALNQKCLTFEKIIGWKPEVILDIVAAVNMLSFSAALKNLSTEQLEEFFKKLSPQDRKKFEMAMQDANQSPAEISASVMKIISETRNLFVQGTLKFDKVDSSLAIPDGFESKLEKNEQLRNSGATLSFDGPTLNFNIGGNLSSTVSHGGGNSSAASGAEVEKLQKKIVLLNKELQTLRSENQMMKDKLDKIKKIA